jgi:hypothetical protein
VDQGPKPDPDEDGTVDSDAPSDDENKAEPGWEGQPLAGCMMGFEPDEAEGRLCNWQVMGRCYEEKLDACACVCPGGTAVSTCSSGFPQEDGAVEVYCY